MIDYKHLKRVADKLGIFPKEYYSPFDSNFENYSWNILMSERTLGKTTGWLLLGMLANREYGTIPEYVRLTADMLKPKAVKDLFNTIVANDYVSRITDGKWNDVFYYAERWYYVKKENGKIIEKSDKHFMHGYDLAHTNTLKSSYNNPTGDIIILDEFIDNQTPFNDCFFYLCDSMSTIFRLRENCKCIMLSNCINPRSTWFTEMNIMQDVSSCKIGERKICTRQGDTPVYLEIVANKNVSKIKRSINKLYFGFKNPKLNAITGSDTWAYAEFPLFEKGFFNSDGEYHKYTYDIIQRFYIYHDSFYVQCDICNHELYGWCIMVRNWNIEPYPDDITLVAKNPTKKGEYNYRELKELFDVAFPNLYTNNKWYYKDNSTGFTVKSFIQSIK